MFNVACGETHSVNSPDPHIARLVGRPLEPIHEPARVGEVRMSLADIGKARRLLGYEPAIRLEEGLSVHTATSPRIASLLPEIRERRRWLSLAR